MKILSSDISGGNLKRIQGKSWETNASGKAETGRAASAGNVTHGADWQDDIRYTASPDFPARTSLVETVRERVASGKYNQPETIQKTAERIVESSDMAESTTQGNRDAAFTERVRTGTVADVRSQAGAGYYDQPDMIEKVAERLISALGLG